MMSRLTLYLVVSLSGASVLVLEILGTRVLGPFYGVSLFLWSALISITLAALAAGYALGGRAADRNPTGARLSLLLAIAGLWVLAAPWLRAPVVHIAAGLGLRPAVLVSAALLFFPPLFLLGMVSPYAVRLATRRVEEVGTTTGNLFAISTLASVAAAVLTGFVLIPALGVSRLLACVALTLFAAAALARADRVAALLMVPAIGLTWLTAARAERPAPGVLARVESPYAELRVVEAGGFRYLMLDGGAHTVFRAASGEPHQPYIYVAEIAADLSRPHGRLLLVGLGGGGAAEVFSRRGWQVDAVEIDPEVPKLAAEYFGLKPFYARVMVAEGRQFLQRSQDTYDVVFLDAFGSASIPFHLVTREAFAAAKVRLASGGILALNVETVGWKDPIVNALVATLQTSFRNVIALPTAEPPNQLGNVILLASDRDLAVTPEQLGDPVAALENEDEHFRVVSRHHGWENQYRPRNGVVLTDDWNPVDLRAEEINLVARRWLRTQIPDSLMRE